MRGRRYAKAVVRKGGVENLFLTRTCGWTADWKLATKFPSAAAATEAAQHCGVGPNYGVFPTSRHPMRADHRRRGG